jgi:hypothetical protein
LFALQVSGRNSHALRRSNKANSVSAQRRRERGEKLFSPYSPRSLRLRAIFHFEPVQTVEKLYVHAGAIPKNLVSHPFDEINLHLFS